MSQSEVTCQTGPGAPSSHCMSWAVLSYVVFDILDCKPALSSPAWWSLQVVMGLSRCQAATHFPHQCVVGTVLGQSPPSPPYCSHVCRVRPGGGPLCLSQQGLAMPLQVQPPLPHLLHVPVRQPSLPRHAPPQHGPQLEPEPGLAVV